MQTAYNMGLADGPGPWALALPRSTCTYQVGVRTSWQGLLASRIKRLKSKVYIPGRHSARWLGNVANSMLKIVNYEYRNSQLSHIQYVHIGRVASRNAVLPTVKARPASSNATGLEGMECNTTATGKPDGRITGLTK